MTTFEEIGVKCQEKARNFWQAKKQFDWSCKLCCLKGMRIDCDRCHIAWAHDNVKKNVFPKQAEEYEKKYGRG